jgi:hypothetical protein
VPGPGTFLWGPVDALGAEAALQRCEVQPATAAHHHQLAVEYDLAGEPCGERLDDLREVAGERALLA